MNKLSLDALVRHHLAHAAEGSGRSAETIVGGHDRVLRQTLVALAGGVELAEHESPGEATLQVLAGRVRLTAGGDTWEGRSGDLVAIPDSRHSVTALEPSAILLTVAKAEARR